jgi:FSR family fosmidomycin resistance protein-like MFS transporter
MTRRFARGGGIMLLAILTLEFLDEFVGGGFLAGIPLIRQDLFLTYTQIGLLFTIPSIVAVFIEPFYGLLAEAGYRRRLLLIGGLAFAFALVIIAASVNFGMILIGMSLLFPASGALIGMAQITLMDAAPQRHEQNMARWTFAGSLGVVAGPLALATAAGAGPGWRGFLLGSALITMLATLWTLRVRDHQVTKPEQVNIMMGLREAFSTMRQWPILRWLVLLGCSDLMLDQLFAFLALYLVDVVGVTTAQAALGVTVWTGVGLLGDFLIIPLLERVTGVVYLRLSAAALLILYAAFLLIPSLLLKLVILGLIGLFNAGWYSILLGNLYSALPGRSGLALTINNIFSVVNGVVPLLIGALATVAGLEVAMWLLWLGPLALLMLLPRQVIVPADE